MRTDKCRPELRITELVWEEKPGNGYLLRELFDLLLRDLTDEKQPPTMEPKQEEGGAP